MMRRLFSTDDWLAKHQGVCLFLIFVLALIVNAMVEVA